MQWNVRWITYNCQIQRNNYVYDPFLYATGCDELWLSGNKAVSHPYSKAVYKAS